MLSAARFLILSSPICMARKPFFTGDFKECRHRLPVSGDAVLVWPFELIVPIAITPITDEDQFDDLNVFPAKLDSGFSHNFHIARRHLEEWADMSAETFHATGEEVCYTYANGQSDAVEMPLYDADL